MTSIAQTPDTGEHPAWAVAVQHVEGATFLTGSVTSVQMRGRTIGVQVEQFIDDQGNRHEPTVTITTGEGTIELTPDQATHLAAALAVHAVRAEMAR